MHDEFWFWVIVVGVTLFILWLLSLFFRKSKSQGGSGHYGDGLDDVFDALSDILD